MPDFETIRDAKNDLVLSNQHFAVLFDSTVNSAASTLEDPADGSLVVPTTAEAAGIIEKGAGVSLMVRHSANREKRKRRVTLPVWQSGVCRSPTRSAITAFVESPPKGLMSIERV